MLNTVGTVNTCSIDLSKAFDKMYHHALFIQLQLKSAKCFFNFDSVSDIIGLAKRTYKFLASFDNSDSLLCSLRHAWT